MPKNINNSLFNNSLFASEGYSHLRSMKSGVLGATMKFLLAIMVVTATGLTGNFAWAQQCPNSNNFQYGEYGQKCLLELLDSLALKGEAPCSGSVKNKKKVCADAGCKVYNRGAQYKEKPGKWASGWASQIPEYRRKICPYSMTVYNNLGGGDKISPDHMVSIAEAHDSGLCDENRAHERDGFANDPENITMAKEEVNIEKSEKDFAEWNPSLASAPAKPDNLCWFASRVVQVRVKWKLSIDDAERKALEDVLKNCENFAFQEPRSNAEQCGKL